jgi:hypothetical protein
VGEEEVLGKEGIEPAPLPPDGELFAEGLGPIND